MNQPNDVVVHTQMLIRRPASEVFRAFIDPSVTSKFWFTKSSGVVAQGQRLRWDWEMYGVGTDVYVTAVEPNRRIAIEWDDPPSPVEWNFVSRDANETLVTISSSGFRGDISQVLAQAVDSKGGFTIVLAGLKALLEHGIELKLVHDQYPDAARTKDA